jgi:tRNA-Thr(GGU) m(6)t(6)A37 methyltransferase TsaA
MSESFTLTPIGRIASPHRELAGMPIQPAGARDVSGRLELEPEYAPGLADLDGFSHLILVYVFHQSRGHELQVTPFMDTEPRGLFATRAPRRPNPVGLSVVRLERISANVVHVLDVDVLDGTPLLDIKPYVPDFDAVAGARTGWLQKASHRAGTMKSDGRFSKE